MHAKPQLNGNSVEDFREGYTAVLKIHDALLDAMKKLHQDVISARNYQHVETDLVLKMQEDAQRFQDRAERIRKEVLAMATELEEAIGAD